MATTFTAEVKGYEKVVAEYNKVQKEVTKLREEIKRLNDATGQTGETHKKSSESAKKHFDVMAAGRKEITSMVAGYVSLQGAIQLIGDAMRYVQDETRKAVDSMKGLQPAEGQMAQIAKNTDDLAAMSMEADRLAATYGVKRDDTRMAIVEGRNLGIDNTAIEAMTKYSDIASLTAQTTLGGKMSMIFGQEKVKPQEAVSMGLLASGGSAAQFEELAKGIPSAAEGGRLAGASDEETLALYSVFAGQFPTATTGAERVKALGGKISKSSRLKGKGFAGAMTEMAGMKEDELFGGDGTVFGADLESKSAYEALKANMPAFQAMTQQVGAEKATMRAGGESFIERQFRQKFDPSMAQTGAGKQYVGTQLALEEQRKAEIAREIANEAQLARTGIGTQTAIDVQMAGMKQRGAAGPSQFWAEKAGKAAQVAGGGEFVAGAVTAGVGDAAESLPVGAVAGMAGPLSPVVNVLQSIYGAVSNRARSGSTAMNAATLAGQQQR